MRKLISRKLISAKINLLNPKTAGAGGFPDGLKNAQKETTV